MNWIKKKYFELRSAKAINPLTANESRFSLIISSYSRAENIFNILTQYSTYKCFAEIIIWHNGPEPLERLNKSDLVQLISSDDMGLASRYAAGLLAKSPIVFLHDDDLILPEASFIEMAQKHLAYGGTVSIEGKNLYSDGTYGESVKPKLGYQEECEIHLNRCICTSRFIIPSFFTFLYQTKLSLNPQGGGGEDIVYSYAARSNTGKKPLALGLAFKNLKSDKAISVRFGNQHKNRTEIAKVCRQVFEDQMS